MNQNSLAQVDVGTKLAVLKKAFLDEKKKNEKLEGEVNTLKEQLSNKEQTISKLYEKLEKSENKDLFGQKNIKNIISGFFNEEQKPTDNIIPTRKEIEELQEENLKFREQIFSLQKEKEDKENKIEELNKYSEEILIDHQQEIVKLRTETDEQLKDMREKYDKMSQELNEKNKIFVEKELNFEAMKEVVKGYDEKLIDKERQISNLKEENQNLSKTIMLKVEQMDKLYSELGECQDEVERYKMKLKKLRAEFWESTKELTEEELKAINIDYTFVGFFVYEDPNKNREKCSLVFEEEEKAIRIRIGVNEMIYHNKQITDMYRGNHHKNRVWISVFDKSQKKYKLEFTPKQVDFILKFYEQIKYKDFSYKDHAICLYSGINDC